MPDKITGVLVINYFDRVSKDSGSGGERPPGMHETLCKFLFHCHKYHDTAKPFDPEKAWTDHLNRLADIDRLYPSKSPLLARHISPPLSTKRLFDIHGEYFSLLAIHFLFSKWVPSSSIASQVRTQENKCIWRNEFTVSVINSEEDFKEDRRVVVVSSCCLFMTLYRALTWTLLLWIRRFVSGADFNSVIMLKRF